MSFPVPEPVFELPLELALPVERYRRSYLAADQEWVAPLPDGKFIATDETFAVMLVRIEGVRTGEHIPDGFMKQLELWLVAGDEYFGKIHALARPHIMALGEDPLLAMCKASNVAARQLIGRYDGVVDAELPGDADGEPSVRYRVPLAR
jgi:hypothetical protein